MTERLSRAALARLDPSVARPAYDFGAHGVGIVHIGAGAFHRAHQAVATDDALAASGGDWRILGVSLRSTEIADVLEAQDGLFTVVSRSGEGDRARVVGSVAGVVAASRDREAVLSALAAPTVRIVSFTVTEKAYGIDRATGDIDPEHPAIAADLASPRSPIGVVGVLVEGLRRRYLVGLPPFTGLCCDNLPKNGELTRSGVIGFARRVDPELARWIEAEMAFPSSMVDRITPAPTDETRALAKALTGFADEAAVETEPFSQWVIEDAFPDGRPTWEAGGALFVADVAPYERMKLRMVNGAHSMLAYTGFLAGHTYVRDVMADGDLAALVRRHVAAAAATLQPLPGIDLADYGAALAARFANPAIAHRTDQIATDGTEKLPQRIAAPALETLRAGGDARPFAFALAAWMRYCIGRTEAGTTFPLRDPREALIAAAVEAAAGDPARITANLLSLPVFPPELGGTDHFAAEVGDILATMMQGGMRAAIAAETARSG